MLPNRTAFFIFALCGITHSTTIAEPVSHCNAGIVSTRQTDTNANPFDTEDLPIETSADSASFEAGIARFKGDVVFESGNTKLQADEVIFHHETQQAQLTGNITIDNSNTIVSGDSASVNLADDSSKIINAHYEITNQQIRGKASSIQIDKSNQIKIESGSYTRCPPENKIWEVKAKDIFLNRESGQGKVKHARLNIYNTPVLYLPYAQFPISDQRQSGLLFPNLTDTNSGIDIATPYYFNIAPNIDATLSPRYKDGHGYLTEGELRWLNRFDNWSLSGSYIDSDESFNQRSRWLLDIKERGAIGDKVTTQIDYTDVSDDGYLRDLNTTSLSVNRTTQLAQTANIRYTDLAWSAGASIQKFQTIDTAINQTNRVYEKQPELWLRYQSNRQPFQLRSDIELRYSNFAHPSLIDGDRTYGRVGLLYPIHWPGIEITPTLGIEQQLYNLDSQSSNEQDTLSVAAPYGTLAIRSVFEKYKSNPGSPTQNRLTTLEPGLFYLYRKITDGRDDQSLIPGFDSNLLTVNKNQLTRRSRFGGYDNLEETNQLAASITQNHYKANGFRQLSATVGQIFYFQRLLNQNALSSTSTNQRTKTSALIASLEFTPNTQWQTLTSILWDTRSDQISQGSTNIRYRQNTNKNTEKRSLFNLGYNYRRQNNNFELLNANIEQAEFSTVSFINRSWAIIGKYQYDLQNSRRAESLAGIEYDDCCIKLKLVFRDGLIYDPDNNAAQDQRERSVFLQIEFKGLSSIGRSLDNVLKESILDY